MARCSVCSPSHHLCGHGFFALGAHGGPEDFIVLAPLPAVALLLFLAFWLPRAGVVVLPYPAPCFFLKVNGHFSLSTSERESNAWSLVAAALRGSPVERSIAEVTGTTTLEEDMMRASMAEALMKRVRLIIWLDELFLLGALLSFNLFLLF